MRVKRVYQERGEWADATAQPWECEHPAERLRFDGSFAFPFYMYCRGCGTRYLPPWTGLPDDEAEAMKARLAALSS